MVCEKLLLSFTSYFSQLWFHQVFPEPERNLRETRYKPKVGLSNLHFIMFIINISEQN